MDILQKLLSRASTLLTTTEYNLFRKLLLTVAERARAEKELEESERELKEAKKELEEAKAKEKLAYLLHAIKGL